MKKTNDRKVIMGEFFVTGEGLAFCLFPDPKAKTACGALVRGDHEGFASEVVVASDCDKPITASDYLRLRCCASDLRDLEVTVTVKLRYTAPVVVRESVFVFPKDFKCADFKFGDLRFIRGYRPLYEVVDK